MKAKALGLAVLSAAMVVLWAGASFAAANRQEFAFPRAVVYAALVETLTAEGYKIKQQDPAISRVTASAGINAFSWGENMSFAVADNGPSASVVEYASARKVGTTIFDGGRGQRLFDKVVLALSNRLKGAPVVQQASSTASLADDLEKLATLRDKGILTDAEFNAKKAQLLGLGGPAKP